MTHKVGVIGCGFVGTAVSVGLETLLQNKVEIREYDKFKETESLNDVVENSNILFICLPTPMTEDGKCDTSIIEGEIENINNIASSKKSIVIKSTVPPGTTKKLSNKYNKHTFTFNPEFLTEKKFMEDFLTQDRIILGRTHKFDERVEKLYKDFQFAQKKSAVIYNCSSDVAEMTKYIGNCFLATKVMFFNEIYQICQAADIDFREATKLACADERIGKSHTQVPGPDGQHGYGGSCFPKDINALINFAKEKNIDPMILESVWTKNLLVRENYEWETLAQVNGNYEGD